MALVHWEPLREMEMLRHQMDRLFDDLGTVNYGSSNASRETRTAWVPAIELKQSNANIVLRVEIPGVAAKDLDIQVTRDTVLVSGDYRQAKQAEEKSHFRSEFKYGKFHRVVSLPAQVQNDQVGAEFQDGILTLTLPKVEAERRKVVRINLGEVQPASAKLEAGNGDGTLSDQAVEVKPASESD